MRSRSRGGARITLEVDAKAAGLLVLAESWYPGWTARIDGRDARVHRVNHGLMGLRVPPGKHRITLLFSPSSLRWGSALSGLALLIVLGLLLWPLIRRKLFRPTAL